MESGRKILFPHTNKYFNMKKYFMLLPAILMLSLVYAQEEYMLSGSRKISKKETPQAIIDSLNKRFPNAKAVQSFKVPKDAAAKGWEITESDKIPPDEEVEYYVIDFKRDDFKYYAMYDRNGNLLRSKYEENSATLPEPVKTALMSIKDKYPGYKLKEKTHYKNQNSSKSEEYYEVVAANGKKKMYLYYKPDGTLIKVKD